MTNSFSRPYGISQKNTQENHVCFLEGNDKTGPLNTSTTSYMSQLRIPDLVKDLVTVVLRHSATRREESRKAIQWQSRRRQEIPVGRCTESRR